MAAFLEKVLGKKADELRKRMERSIIVSKKLTDALDKNTKTNDETNKMMKELINELIAHRKTMEEMVTKLR